ncbi:MBOAT family O-acyltransferase [Tenuibacillus multivorans]|uniref:D-alanyl-lipoteichoic acid acyltransferase DltB, MBOAT superfamily n=1 Tax=Tenuibacillus multivorans TaxID=237069 RepID=A0A1G9X5W8_9BACI|nr:MBOAT family protein [Tenuibacillus multivorans]GEL78649.1 peptidoglycan O-acetyltransferase [Tenuibacillus multivorans]SDM92087.1 D-alanyl-lipoteichoic acid acyltransferase DltB, MBOAT superfamily [Tenuibacillus multivorans]
MLFNSFEFIFVFLPVMFIGYYIFNRFNFTLAKIWLLCGSLFFYSWWNPIYLPLLLSSILVNFLIGIWISKTGYKKSVLTLGIMFNVSLLGFFKYYDFLIENVNFAFGANFSILHLVLPLAISFFTFQQIAYLVDSYRGTTKERNLLNYALFVSFFPQLIAGPIVHHSIVMPQYMDRSNRKLNPENIAKGLFIFSIGLFKKVGIADTFAVWANQGFSSAASLTFFDGWVTSLAYTFQLYFDFSGYTDMAIGAALLFNIRLPINFNSPYKAVSIQDFWRRWHITLTNFLTKYIYVPLGGSRVRASRIYGNILIIFFISGLWHGAGWTFVVWGVLHGLASVIHRAWNRMGFRLNKVIAWFVTFQFVNATWVLFRAPDFTAATQVLSAMVGLNGVQVPSIVNAHLGLGLSEEWLYTFTLTEDLSTTMLYLIGAFLIAILWKNSNQLTENLRPTPLHALFAAGLFIYAALQLQQVSEFLYFNF